MGLPNVMQTGQSGMHAAKSAIATAGHNITNANTEGYSRQRVHYKTNTPQPGLGSKGVVGRGTLIERIERVNDRYLEKQIRNADNILNNLEEKEVGLRQLEDVFNELGGEGLNRIMSRFFNEFRKLANNPESEAVRQAVREASQALVNDFSRVRKSVRDIGNHIDSRLEAYTREVNTLASQVKDLNMKIKGIEVGGASPNDLLDQRDLALKKLSSFMDVALHTDKDGAYYVDIVNVGPLVAGPGVQEFSVFRSKANEDGKPENALDVKSQASTENIVTQNIRGGKIGALIEVRDQTLSTILDRLDEMAFGVSKAVNQIHEQGFTATGAQGVSFFNNLTEKHRAADKLELSDAVKANVNNIASGAVPDAPGDNRIAVALSGIQHLKIMNDGTATVDDWYNSIISDVGVYKSRNGEAMSQQKNIVSQLGKMREQISGVSIDEETANLMQAQHVFDASAKVIQVADQMLEEVLNLRR